MKAVEFMTPEELFVEASRIRQQIVTSAEKLGQVYTLLYTQVRKNPSDLTNTFVNISNAGKRFAGSVVLGAKRTEAVDRALANTKKALLEAKEQERLREEREERRRAQKEAAARAKAQRSDPYGVFTSSNEIPYDQTPDDLGSDLDALYGEE
jgi:hypothetical protein